MKTPVYLLTVLLFTVSNVTGQDEICGFDSFLARRIRKNPEIKENLDKMQSAIRSGLKSKGLLHNREIITIPVVVHVVWKEQKDNISTDRILDQIQMLNDVFTNMHPDLEEVPEEFKPVIGNPSLNFCMAKEDPEGHPTSGIIRVKTEKDRIGASDSIFYSALGGSTAWDTDSYLNIWITGHFGNVGYAFFPGEGGPSKDGIVLLADAVETNNPDNMRWNGRVAVHEIGHYLGLHHIWGDDLYASDPNCENDDGFSDTPLQWRYSYSCPSKLEPTPFSCGSNDMYVNFMDYTPDECLSMFTQQQTDHMLQVLFDYRPGLLKGDVACHSFSGSNTEDSFIIYPNPTRNQFKIRFQSGRSVFGYLELYDLRGILILQEMDFYFEGKEITLPDLAPGVYFVRLGKEVQKLVIH